MAIFSCPECKAEISDQADACPHCGFTMKRCSECGAILSQKAAYCPKCGNTKFTYKKPHHESSNSDSNSDLDGHPAVKVIAILGCIFIPLLGIICGIIAFCQGKTKDGGLYLGISIASMFLGMFLWGLLKGLHVL